MTSTARVDLSAEDVAQIVNDIVGAFLGAEATRTTADKAPPRPVVACVHVSGAFAGSVVCSVTQRFAVLCAERMLAVHISEVDDEAVVDAIGEIVNMVGGSVKALLPEPSTLSLPVVTLGDGAELLVPGTTSIASVDLVCEGEPLQVTVLNKRD